eukprot:7245450-Pyramimonas_sp.AAC.1
MENDMKLFTKAATSTEHEAVAAALKSGTITDEALKAAADAITATSGGHGGGASGASGASSSSSSGHSHAVHPEELLMEAAMNAAGAKGNFCSGEAQTHILTGMWKASCLHSLEVLADATKVGNGNLGLDELSLVATETEVLFVSWTKPSAAYRAGRVNRVDEDGKLKAIVAARDAERSLLGATIVHPRIGQKPFRAGGPTTGHQTRENLRPSVRDDIMRLRRTPGRATTIARPF